MLFQDQNMPFTLGESICENNSYAKKTGAPNYFKKMFHCILHHEKDPLSNDNVLRTNKKFVKHM